MKPRRQNKRLRAFVIHVLFVLTVVALPGILGVQVGPVIVRFVQVSLFAFLLEELQGAQDGGCPSAVVA